jgi:hypothetical protein
VFSKLLKALGVLDYGWLEPYFLIKKKVYWAGRNISQAGVWPNSRLMISVIFIFLLLLIVTIFIY